MLKRLLFGTVAALLVSVLVVSSAAAQGAQGARKGLFRNLITVFAPPTPQEERTIATTVGLSEDQKTQMRAVNQRYRSDSSALMAKYNSAYEDVVSLMQSTDPNKSDVAQRLKTFHQVHQEVVEREVGYWTDFKSIMTPEQNQKFWNLFEQSRVRGGQGGGAQAGRGKPKGGDR